MKFLLKIICLTIFCIITGACSFNNGRYSVISDRPITLYTVTSPKRWKVATAAEGESTKHSWLFLTLEDITTVDYAVGRILDEHLGDYLENAEVDYVGFNIMGIYHYSSWRVKGDVIRVYQ